MQHAVSGKTRMQPIGSGIANPVADSFPMRIQLDAHSLPVVKIDFGAGHDAGLESWTQQPDTVI